MNIFYWWLGSLLDMQFKLWNVNCYNADFYTKWLHGSRRKRWFCFSLHSSVPLQFSSRLALFWARSGRCWVHRRWRSRSSSPTSRRSSTAHRTQGGWWSATRISPFWTSSPPPSPTRRGNCPITTTRLGTSSWQGENMARCVALCLSNSSSPVFSASLSPSLFLGFGRALAYSHFLRPKIEGPVHVHPVISNSGQIIMVSNKTLRYFGPMWYTQHTIDSTQ